MVRHVTQSMILQRAPSSQRWFCSYSWIEPPKLISSGRVGWKPLLVVVVGESGLMVVMDVVMGSTPIVAPAAPARGEIYSSERRGLIRECAVIC